MKAPHDIIHSVRLSERATLLAEGVNQYTFVVDRKASKPEIARAVEAAFGKKVVQVRTLHVGGKPKRRGNGPLGRTNHYKKAIVRLKEGDKIDLS